jgi:hypothetical protein
MRHARGIWLERPAMVPMISAASTPPVSPIYQTIADQPWLAAHPFGLSRMSVE